MNLHHDDLQVDWQPGWEWLAAVLAIHLLATAPWLPVFGPWPLAPCALSLLWHVGVFARHETWRFALHGETVVVFEPPRRRPRGTRRSAGALPGQRRAARLRGSPWMTEHWLVVPTSRRVLVLRAGRYPPALFARLRRAFRATG